MGDHLDDAVIGVEEVLKELVGAGAIRVEPHGAGFGLAEFLTGGRGDQGEGQAISGLRQLPANQVERQGSSHCVAPYHPDLASQGRGR